jgi:hypothetical protein
MLQKPHLHLLFGDNVMYHVDKTKLESRISLQYRRLLQLTNTPHVDPKTLVSLELAIEQDYEQLNKLKDPTPPHASTPQISMK